MSKQRGCLSGLVLSPWSYLVSVKCRVFCVIPSGRQSRVSPIVPKTRRGRGRLRASIRTVARLERCHYIVKAVGVIEVNGGFENRAAYSRPPPLSEEWSILLRACRKRYSAEILTDLKLPCAYIPEWRLVLPRCGHGPRRSRRSASRCARWSPVGCGQTMALAPAETSLRCSRTMNRPLALSPPCSGGGRPGRSQAARSCRGSMFFVNNVK